MRPIIAMAALFVAAIAAFIFYQQRLAANERKLGVPVHQDTAPAEVAEPLAPPPALPDHMLWTLDERWQRADREGEEILGQIRELYRWQEEEGGDPIRFRREKKGLSEKLGPLLEGLLALQVELERHPGAAGVVEVRIREFSGAMSGVLR
ncbi:MAG: hypothetical protein MK209_01500 [Planctomycetes bacterium]|nr:hypothetical protein [Planctomycetota bacterium]